MEPPPPLRSRNLGPNRSPPSGIKDDAFRVLRARIAALEAESTALRESAGGARRPAARGERPFAQIVGYDRDELLRLDFQTITHPGDLAADEELLRRLQAAKIANTTWRSGTCGRTGRRSG
jgi:hypothetical protein